MHSQPVEARMYLAHFPDASVLKSTIFFKKSIFRMVLLWPCSLLSITAWQLNRRWPE